VRLMNHYYASKTHTNPLCGSIFGILKVFNGNNKEKLVHDMSKKLYIEM
jgi:hypothetical protein